jgi:hypothetical protein
MFLQQGGHWLPIGGQGARIAASSLVPQLHKPAAEVSMLVGDRFGGSVSTGSSLSAIATSLQVAR